MVIFLLKLVSNVSIFWFLMIPFAYGFIEKKGKEPTRFTPVIRFLWREKRKTDLARPTPNLGTKPLFFLFFAEAVKLAKAEPFNFALWTVKREIAYANGLIGELQRIAPPNFSMRYLKCNQVMQ
jgi:hypothetical protein